MRDLKKIVDEYLSRPTEYAIQIVGNWGTGKTYYYKKNIESLINNKEVIGDSRKKYKPIYISLFGLKSTEEIATKIVIEFYESKFFKNYFKRTFRRRRLRITEGILKIGFRGFLAFKGFGNVDDYLTDIKKVGENVLATDELVLCFDDLERKDSALNIKDLTGYINSLLDEKVKVLLISNEDILKKEELDYKDLKEKIIGITVAFSVDIKSTIEEIIETKFPAYPEFRKFLNKEINLLLEITDSVGNNFRHIIYALNVLHHFFGEFRKNIFDSKHDISEKLKEEFPGITRLILAFSIEYKNSNLSYQELLEYNNHIPLYVFSLPNNELSVKDNTESALSKFVQKYRIDKSDYHFYESIFKYVTYRDEFSLAEFIIDFKNQFHLEDGKVLPQYELADELALDKYFNLSDKECLEKFEKVFEFVDAGLYKPEDCLFIMFLAQRFKEIFNVDLEERYERIVEGLKKSIRNAGNNYKVLFGRFKGVGKSSSFSDHQNKLIDIGRDEIKLYKEKRKDKRLKEIIYLFLNDYKEFKYKLKAEESFRYEISSFFLFNNISDQEFIDNIKRNENSMILSLEDLFMKRYVEKQYVEAESSSIKNYIKKLDEYSKELIDLEGSKIRLHLVNELISTLSEIVIKNEQN